jgi:hypothetical protein
MMTSIFRAVAAERHVVQPSTHQKRRESPLEGMTLSIGHFRQPSLPDWTLPASW